MFDLVVMTIMIMILMFSAKLINYTRVCKIVVVAYFITLTRHSFRRTERNHEKFIRLATAPVEFRTDYHPKPRQNAKISLL
jgi:hypothetical protein